MQENMATVHNMKVMLRRFPERGMVHKDTKRPMCRRGSSGEVFSRLARPALGRRLRVQAQVGKNLLDHRRLQDAATNRALTVSLHRQRLLWSRQIEKSFDRTQPITEVQDGELIATFLPLALGAPQIRRTGLQRKPTVATVGLPEVQRANC
jgi:hypothetical protein